MKVRASSPRLLLRRDDLFRLGVNTGPQRGCIFTKGPAELLGYATSEIASSNLDIDATKKLPGEGFKRPWPPLIKMDAAVRNGINSLFAGEP